MNWMNDAYKQHLLIRFLLFFYDPNFCTSEGAVSSLPTQKNAKLSAPNFQCFVHSLFTVYVFLITHVEGALPRKEIFSQ